MVTKMGLFRYFGAGDFRGDSTNLPAFLHGVPSAQLLMTLFSPHSHSQSLIVTKMNTSSLLYTLVSNEESIDYDLGPQHVMAQN